MQYCNIKVKDFIEKLKDLSQEATICVLLDKAGWTTCGDISILYKENKNGEKIAYAIDGRINK